MRVRFTLRAAQQIEKILDDIAEQAPHGSTNVQKRIYAFITILERHPRAGRVTSRPDVRRLVVTPYLYLIDYRCTDTEIIIQRFRHASRKPLN